MLNNHFKKLLLLLVILLIQSCQKDSTAPEISTNTAPDISIISDSTAILYHIGQLSEVPFEIKTSDAENDFYRLQIWLNNVYLGESGYSQLEFSVSSAMLQPGEQQQLKVSAKDYNNNISTVIKNFTSRDLLLWSRDYQNPNTDTSGCVFEFSDFSVGFYDGADSIFRYSSDGNLLFSSHIDCGFYNNVKRGSFMDKLSDDRLITLYDSSLIVLDKNFNVLQKSNIDLYEGILDGLIRLNNNNILIFGEYDSDMLLKCYNLDGTLQWQKRLGGNLIETRFTADQATDGSIYVSCSTTSYGNGGTDILVCKLTPQGDLIWQKTVGTNKGEANYSLKATRDGGCALGAFYDKSYITYYKHYDGWLFKLDSQGNQQWKTEAMPIGKPLQILQQADGSYLIINRYEYGNGLFGGNRLTSISSTGSFINDIILETGILAAEIISSQQLLLYYTPYMSYNKLLKVANIGQDLK